MNATIQDAVNWLAEIGIDPEDGWATAEIIKAQDTDGLYRHVILCDDIAYKIEKDDNGCNRREFDLYHLVSPETRAMMAACIAISDCGRVLAMRRIDYTAQDAVDDTEQADWHTDHFTEVLRYRLQEDGFSCDEVQLLVSDNHPGNVGYNFDGEMVWIDYGQRYTYA